jgi:cation diffusion facilitator CzcD-associated flavoprotein CzcO
MTVDAAKTEGAPSKTQVLIIGAGPAGFSLRASFAATG